MPPPPLDCCGVLAGACRPPPWLLEELLPEPVDEPLPPEVPDEPEEPEEPELDDEPEVDEVPPVVAFVAAWLVPGRMAATTPAATTLAAVTVTVVAVSRRRPCSRSATARATWRADA